MSLISEFLTWEDLSKKRTSPIIIKNPSLFFSRSLTNSDDITDFEYFIEKYYNQKVEHVTTTELVTATFGEVEKVKTESIETQQAYQDLKSIACRQIWTKSEEREDKEIDGLITGL